MELRSVAYNPNPALGMGGMQGMPGMMPEAQMPGQVMPGMMGMPETGMYNVVDPCCPPPCPPPCPPVYCEPMMHHHCPMPEPTPAHEVYVVKKGDTVYKIAKRYGTTMQAIILGNDLRNPDLIYPGQILFIPGASY